MKVKTADPRVDTAALADRYLLSEDRRRAIALARARLLEAELEAMAERIRRRRPDDAVLLDLVDRHGRALVGAVLDEASR